MALAAHAQEASITTARIAFSTLAFPDADLATAVSLGRSWGYAGVELRLIDGELIDPAMPAAARARVKRTLAAAGLPAVAVDSSIRLTGEHPAAELRQFLELASDWEAPLVRVFGGALPGDGPGRRARLEAAARVLEETAPAAERLGVAIGVETHDAFAASSVVAELLALVDSAAVGAVWDSHHPHRMGERAADVWPISARAFCSPRSKTPGPILAETTAGSWCSSARARCPSATCSPCSPPAATRAGCRWSGRNGGTPRLPPPRWRFLSTWRCCAPGPTQGASKGRPPMTAHGCRRGRQP